MWGHTSFFSDFGILIISWGVAMVLLNSFAYHCISGSLCMFHNRRIICFISATARIIEHSDLSWDQVSFWNPILLSFLGSQMIWHLPQGLGAAVVMAPTRRVVGERIDTLYSVGAFSGAWILKRQDWNGLKLQLSLSSSHCHLRTLQIDKRPQLRA